MLYTGKPFLFGELKGTSWYRRFIAEEYYIILDQYPDREIIEDRELTNLVDRNSEPYIRYREKIIDLFCHSTGMIDLYSYWDVLLHLRKIKQTLFDDISILHTNRHLRPGKDKLPEILPQMKNSLIKRLEKAEEILFIPGKPQNFSQELEEWLLPSAAKRRTAILCFNDPLYRGVTKRLALRTLQDLDFNSAELHISDPRQTDLSFLKAFSNEKQLIFTTNIWAFLSLFRDIPGLAFSLDNSEWCARALFGRSYDPFEADGNSLKPGRYTEKLIKRQPVKGYSCSGYFTKPFLQGIDITGVHYTSLNIPRYLNGQRPEDFTERIVKDSKWISEYQNRESLNFTSSFFRICDGKSFEVSESDPEAVQISSILVNEDAVIVKPLLYDSMVDAENTGMEGEGFLSCFNYYFTTNLVKVYNKTIPKEQQLKIENFFIDYLGFFNGASSFETLPLFRKAFLGRTVDGSLFAGHFRLKAVTVKIDGKEFLFSKEDINKRESSQGHGLYLPEYSEKAVGEGRYCLVVIQDQIIYKGPGPCTIPPVGAVIILKESETVTSDTVGFSIDFEGLPVEKERIQWMIGGFNLLAAHGTNFYRSYDESMKSLEMEGWFSPRSRQTQETQLSPDIRQPRCVFGRTSKNRLILSVFSGRSRLSRGATFSETVTHVTSLLHSQEKIDFLINFDGGASASLVAHRNGAYRNLSLTAPSAGNPMGTPRRLNAWFSLTMKNQNNTLGEN